MTLTTFWAKARLADSAPGPRPAPELARRDRIFCPAGVITNITEHITTYGIPKRPAAPNFGVIDADTAGELVAEGIATGKFLILTTDDAATELRERGNDIDAYLEKAIRDYA